MSKFQDMFFNSAADVVSARDTASTLEQRTQSRDGGAIGANEARSSFMAPCDDERADVRGAQPEDGTTARGNTGKGSGPSQVKEDKDVPAFRRTQTGYGVFKGIDPPLEYGGRNFSRIDPRKYKYDAVRASTYPLRFKVTRDDRMPVEDACDKLEQVRSKCGIVRGQHEETVVAAFDTALWFCHTVNSASRLNPGRSTFSVPGCTEDFSYLDVLQILGSDARRFFRAFADDIADVNRRVLSEYDPYDVESTERWSWLMDVAVRRNMTKYPYLAHDSAEACIHLTLPERAALAASKADVLAKAEPETDDQVQVTPKKRDGRSARTAESWRRT